jgi:hypothetical protein
MPYATVSPGSYGSADNWFSGWRSLWDVATGKEDDRAADLDRREYELMQERLRRGVITTETYNNWLARKASNTEPSARQQVADAFVEGAKEGADRMQRGVRETLSAPINWAFGAIPWQLWLVGLVVLFWWLGGPVYLRGILAKAK